MKESTQEIIFESSDWYQDQTAHGLLVLAYEQARRDGFFAGLTRFVSLPIKTVTYSVHDKFATLWASILVGCDHTVEINAKLGAHEQALAAVFGLERFPDQSGINRLLRACTQQTVAQMRELHLTLLEHKSRARRRRLHKRLERGAVLYIDLDQRGITVSGKHYELAEPGHFTRKRSHRGYQLSMAFVGGPIGEVIDEYFDPGRTPALGRIDELLASIERVRTAWGIAPDQVVIRGDAQYGTPAIVAKITAYGFGYLVKGISPHRARCLARDLAEADFVEVSPRAEGEPRWVADLGTREFVGRGPTPTPIVRARTLLVRWREPAGPGASRPGPQGRAKRAEQPPATRECLAYLWTNLDAKALPAKLALDGYDDRATIERYFRDEQETLGARSVRTHTAAGAAVFQWMVAITNNLVRWMRARCFAKTELAQYGVGRLVRRAFQIPARLVRTLGRVRVIVPERHALAAMIIDALGPAPPGGRAAAPAPPGACP
jgi:DDE family transposase